MTTPGEETGLLDLTTFTAVVDHVVRRATRGGECATVLSIRIPADLPPGPSGTRDDSAVLDDAARLLRFALRGEDVIARLSDDELAVALPDTDADGGEVVVAWINAQFSERGIATVQSAALDAGSCVLVGRATFEPLDGPASVVRLLEAARASLSGPCSVVGTASAPSEVGADSAGRARGTPPGPSSRGRTGSGPLSSGGG